MAEFRGHGSGVKGAMPMDAVAVDAMCKLQAAVDTMRVATNQMGAAQADAVELLGEVRDATADMRGELATIGGEIADTNQLLRELIAAVREGLTESAALREDITLHREAVDRDREARDARTGVSS